MREVPLYCITACPRQGDSAPFARTPFVSTSFLCTHFVSIEHTLSAYLLPAHTRCQHRTHAHTRCQHVHVDDTVRRARLLLRTERDFLMVNLLDRIHFIIEMILVDRSCAMRVESPCPGSLISTFLVRSPAHTLCQHVRKVDIRLPGKGIQTPMARGRYTKNIGGSGPVGCQ